MVILGIDPGFDRLGCAILKKENGKEELLFSTCLNSRRGDPHGERLLMLGKEINKIIDEYKPNWMAIEKLFFTSNQKTAIKVAESRGMLLYIAATKSLEVVEFTPLEIKMALTGYGKAEKWQVQKMVQSILKLNPMPKSDDEIDAIACALTVPNNPINKDIL